MVCAALFSTPGTGHRAQRHRWGLFRGGLGGFCFTWNKLEPLAIFLFSNGSGLFHVKQVHPLAVRGTASGGVAQPLGKSLVFSRSEKMRPTTHQKRHGHAKGHGCIYWPCMAAKRAPARPTESGSAVAALALFWLLFNN